jgi:glycosyltransferase involved in cell wall biosynthesis
MKRVLFYFPQKPYPPQTGAHKRCLQLLEGLKTLGCKIRYASSAYRTSAWTEAAEQELTQYIGCDISIFRPTLIQRGISAGIDFTKRYSIPSRELLRHLWQSYGREWFSKLFISFKPDVLLINYANYDSIVDWKIIHECNSIIEMHDMMSLNKKMRLAMTTEVGKRAILTGNNIDNILDINFFKNKQIVAEQCEYQIFDKYKYTTCISMDDMKEVARNTQRTQAVHIPMTFDVHNIVNKYEAEALFCVGPNPFNSQGYFYFVNKVLPIISRRQPDFSLKITGYFYENRCPPKVDGIIYAGFIDVLKPVYTLARFFICPVFGGTGQQVKIVEAMAHGLPVVAFESAAARSPIRHGQNGMIASSAEEFAEHVLTLWSDRRLCKKLGDSARLTIAEEYNGNRLLDKLAYVVG